MIKEIEKAKEGYEKVVEVFDELISNIEKAKEEEIAAIEKKYEDRLYKYNSDRSNYVEVSYEEVPDYEEENSEFTEELQEDEQMGDSTNELHSV